MLSRLTLNDRRHFNSRFPSALAILLASFVLLALFYSLIIPIFEGPDEDDHFRYVKFITDHRALPVQQFVTGGGAAGHQGWQPPLYYALAALLISPIDTSDLADHLWRNPAATYLGDPSCCGRNLYYHTDSENFPFSGTTLAVHLARILSIVFGALTVWGTHRIVSALFPEPAELALAAAAVVAFNPSFLFASALASNDTLLAALSTFVSLLWVMLLTARLKPNRFSLATLGVLIGLALLTKTSALGILLLSLCVLLLLAWQRRNLALAAEWSLTVVLTAALVSGWWFIRNALFYDDPLAFRLMTVSALFPRSGPLTFAELTQISLPWLWQTFWGGPTPGDMHPLILLLLGGLTALAAVGLILSMLRVAGLALPKLSQGGLSSIVILTGWLALLLVAQIRFIEMTSGADQGRYLFPAIAAFALLFVLGLSRFRGLDWLFKRPLTVAVPFGLLALFVPFAYTLPAFARPPLLAASDMAGISHPVQATFGGRLELLGYDLEARETKQGDGLRVALYWRSVAPMPESLRVFVHLIGQDDASAGGVEVIPARGAFPTVYWKPGDTLRDVVYIPTTADAVPGKYAIEVGVYPVGAPGERLVVSESGDDRAVIDAVKVAARVPTAYSPQVRMNAMFGEQARLIGYDLVPNLNAVRLTLYWESTGPIAYDYSVFVHLLDANGKIMTQADRQPQAGHYPTSIWAVGEQIKDEYVLPQPLSGAAYRFHVGLYRPDTGERLPVRMGEQTSDHIEIVSPAMER